MLRSGRTYRSVSVPEPLYNREESFVQARPNDRHFLMSNVPLNRVHVVIISSV